MTQDNPGLQLTRKPTSLCWFPWYPKDWLTSDSVGRMNDAQIVAYVMLLNRQWLCKDGRLPEDMATLTRYAMHDMSTVEMADVLDRFPVQPDGGRANPRLLAEYQAQHRKYAHRRESAGKRWAGNEGACAKRDAMQHAMHDAMHTAMHEHSASGSGSDSSLTPKGDARGGIEWEVECILAARPEFARLNEQTVLAELRLCGESVRAECVRQFVADVSNMPESPRSPIGLLRGYIRRANQPGVGAGVRSGQGESAFAIKSRIEAAQGELDRLPKYADDRTDEQKARAVELRGRIAGWRKELAGG